MASLYLDRPDLRLKRDGKALVLYQGDERQGSVPLALLDRVVIRGTVTLDTGLLGALADQGASVLFQTGRFGRVQAMLLGGGQGDAGRRVAQYSLYRDPAWRWGWSRYLVARKLAGQTRLLRGALRQRPDLRKPLSDALASLEALRLRVVEAPPESLESLRGLEGAAGAAYFGALTQLFPASLGFQGRNRRPPRDPVNACLSLAYTLLHFDAARACHGAGLDPLIGFYHALAPGRESLAADLLEPLRPRVDAWVWGLFRDQTLRDDHFHSEGDACLLGAAGRQHFYGGYEGFARPLRRLLRRVSTRLAQTLRETVDP